MPFLTEAEAAMRLGVGVELLQYFTKKCPKLGGKRLLQTVQKGDEVLFDDAQVTD